MTGAAPPSPASPPAASASPLASAFASLAVPAPSALASSSAPASPASTTGVGEASATGAAPASLTTGTHSISGSVLAGIGLHVPTAPARLHFSHVPAHALLQQTPSVQKPVSQSPFA